MYKRQGIYRWLLERPDDKENIIKSGFKIAFRNILIADAIIILVLVKLNLQYKLLIAIFLNLNSVYPLLQQITRGLKNHTLFAIRCVYATGCALFYQ